MRPATLSARSQHTQASICWAWTSSTSLRRCQPGFVTVLSKCWSDAAAVPPAEHPRHAGHRGEEAAVRQPRIPEAAVPVSGQPPAVWRAWYGRRAVMVSQHGHERQARQHAPASPHTILAAAAVAVNCCTAADWPDAAAPGEQGAVVPFGSFCEPAVKFEPRPLRHGRVQAAPPDLAPHRSARVSIADFCVWCGDHSRGDSSYRNAKSMRDGLRRFERYL